ncbi:MAG: hypothetical protein AAF512_24925, partial [Pseudomonadota bacterium]
GGGTTTDAKEAQITNEKIKKQNCKIATDNLNFLKNNKNVATKDPDSPTGARAFTEEEHAAEMQKAEQQVQKYCQSNSEQQSQ